MLVFKTFSLSSILWSLCPRGRKILSTYEKIFYVEITTFARFLLTRTGLLSNKNIEELKFSLINIRDDLGELERLKLTRKHLFEFENLILCSSSYKLLIEETFIDLEMDNHILGYLQKSITHSEIMRDGLWRNIYLILVSQSIAKEINQNNVGIIMSNEPWKLAYDEFSLRHNIKVFFHKEFSFSLPNIYSLIRRSPIIHFFLKGIKYKEGFFDKNEHSEVNLFLEGRGDIVFEKDGLVLINTIKIELACLGLNLQFTISRGRHERAYSPL